MSLDCVLSGCPTLVGVDHGPNLAPSDGDCANAATEQRQKTIRARIKIIEMRVIRASCTVQDAEDSLGHPEGLLGFSWELTAPSARGRHKMAKRHQKMRSQGRSIPRR